MTEFWIAWSLDDERAALRSTVLFTRHQRSEQLPTLVLEPHHLQLLQRREVGRAGLDPGARQVDADLEIEIGRLLHDVLAGEVVLALPQHLLEALGDAIGKHR